MEHIGKILQKQVDEIVEPRPSLEDLLRLPASKALLTLRDRLQAKITQYEPLQRERRNLENQLALTERRLVLAAKRDEVEATRPDGCWCLGLGGDQRLWDGAYYFGKPCICPEGVIAAREKEQVMMEADRERKQSKRLLLWNHAHIPTRFLECRLSTWPSADLYPQLMEKLGLNNGGSWFFSGPYGVGKTGLAVSLAWGCVQANTPESLLFTTVPRMLGELRDTYNHAEGALTEQEVLNKHTKASLLILDELGVEQVKGTGWVEDRLFQIVGERHEEERPTIFTSNLTLQQLGRRIGERVVWRITEMVGRDHIVNMADMPNLRL